MGVEGGAVRSDLHVGSITLFRVDTRMHAVGWHSVGSCEVIASSPGQRG